MDMSVTLDKEFTEELNVATSPTYVELKSSIESVVSALFTISNLNLYFKFFIFKC